jgi:hypothetical protein
LNKDAIHIWAFNGDYVEARFEGSEEELRSFMEQLEYGIDYGQTPFVITTDESQERRLNNLFAGQNQKIRNNVIILRLEKDCLADREWEHAYVEYSNERSGKVVFRTMRIADIINSIELLEALAKAK